MERSPGSVRGRLRGWNGSGRQGSDTETQSNRAGRTLSKEILMSNWEEGMAFAKWVFETGEHQLHTSHSH